MRGVPASLSIAAHVGAVALAFASRSRERPSEEPVTAELASEVVAVEPVEVDLVATEPVEATPTAAWLASTAVTADPERTASTDPARIGSTSAAGSAGIDVTAPDAARIGSASARIGSTAQIASAAAGASTPELGSKTGRGLAMRGPDLHVGEGFAATLFAHDAPVEPTSKSGRVDPSGRGTSTIHDRVTTVAIGRDGTAHFHDKPDFEVHLDLHLPTPDEVMREVKEMGRDVASWYQDPYRLARVGTAHPEDVPAHMMTAPGACDHWNDGCNIELRDRELDDDEDRKNGLAHGKLDLSDMLHRKLVGDPYASRKLALLDGTRAERAAIGEQHAAEDLDRSVELMRRNLEALWRATRDPAARREALFTMWDECGEGDGAIGEAGERARKAVIGWIRAKLPAGSPGAFTAADLARLSVNRTSTQPFSPYD